MSPGEKWICGSDWRSAQQPTQQPSTSLFARIVPCFDAIKNRNKYVSASPPPTPPRCCLDARPQPIPPAIVEPDTNGKPRYGSRTGKTPPPHRSFPPPAWVQGRRASTRFPPSTSLFLQYRSSLPSSAEKQCPHPRARHCRSPSLGAADTPPSAPLSSPATPDESAHSAPATDRKETAPSTPGNTVDWPATAHPPSTPQPQAKPPIVSLAEGEAGPHRPESAPDRPLQSAHSAGPKNRENPSAAPETETSLAAPGRSTPLSPAGWYANWQRFCAKLENAQPSGSSADPQTQQSVSLAGHDDGPRYAKPPSAHEDEQQRHEAQVARAALAAQRLEKGSVAWREGGDTRAFPDYPQTSCPRK